MSDHCYTSKGGTRTVVTLSHFIQQCQQFISLPFRLPGRRLPGRPEARLPDERDAGGAEERRDADQEDHRARRHHRRAGHRQLRRGRGAPHQLGTGDADDHVEVSTFEGCFWNRRKDTLSFI